MTYRKALETCREQLALVEDYTCIGEHAAAAEAGRRLERAVVALRRYLGRHVPLSEIMAAHDEANGA